MKLTDLPSQFEPIKEIKLGSNTLENVTAILTVKGFIPLLIGEGEPPRVWLYIPANKEGTEWYPLVKDNFSSNPSVEVKVAKKMISIRTPEGTILAGLRGKDNKFIITKLDLRPFGLNVFADEKGLTVMGSVLSQNVFKNVNVMIGID